MAIVQDLSMFTLSWHDSENLFMKTVECSRSSVETYGRKKE